MTKGKKATKAKKNQTMVPECKAFQALLDLMFKTIMGSRNTRRLFITLIESLPDDKKYFDIVVRVLLTLIVQAKMHELTTCTTSQMILNQWRSITLLSTFVRFLVMMCLSILLTKQRWL